MDDSSAERRTPVLSLIVVVVFLTGAVFVSPAWGDDRPGIVKGVVQSAETGQSLPGASVAVRQPSDSSLVGGASTDSTGHFVVENLPLGEHTVVVTFVEYAPTSRSITITASSPTRTLDPVRLEGGAAQMDGATVSMDGKALIQYLKSLSANNVKQVEINTTPSARHEAEGTAGIINIVLDRTENEGLGGGVSASAGVGPRLDGSGTLGYQGGPWTLHGSYSYNHTERTLMQDLLRHQPATDAPPLLDQTTTRQQAYGGHSFNAEIEYALTPQTTFSLTSTGSVRGSDQTHTTTAHRSDAPTSTREVERSHQSFNPDERLSVSHQFDAENHELSADLRYEGEESDTRVQEETGFNLAPRADARSGGPPRSLELRSYSPIHDRVA